MQAGANPTSDNGVVVEYSLVSRGTEPVWMPQGPSGQGAPPQTYQIENVPVWLKYDVKRTVPRARGYVIPASIAKVVPLLLDHGIQVHRFTEPASMELEVYEAGGIRRNEFFQGHYLKAVTGVEKKTETVQVPAGWFYVSTAQAKGNLISYILEPETDDNLITWGYTDNVLQVSPASVEEAMSGLLGDNDLSALTPEQRKGLEAKAAALMQQRQRIPMMRVVKEQPKKLLEVTRYTELNRTRYTQ